MPCFLKRSLGDRRQGHVNNHEMKKYGPIIKYFNPNAKI